LGTGGPSGFRRFLLGAGAPSRARLAPRAGAGAARTVAVCAKAAAATADTAPAGMASGGTKAGASALRIEATVLGANDGARAGAAAPSRVRFAPAGAGRIALAARCEGANTAAATAEIAAVGMPGGGSNVGASALRGGPGCGSIPCSTRRSERARNRRSHGSRRGWRWTGRRLKSGRSRFST
jgi:hypothetical protein